LISLPKWNFLERSPCIRDAEYVMEEGKYRLSSTLVFCVSGQ